VAFTKRPPRGGMVPTSSESEAGQKHRQRGRGNPLCGQLNKGWGRSGSMGGPSRSGSSVTSGTSDSGERGTREKSEHGEGAKTAVSSASVDIKGNPNHLSLHERNFRYRKASHQGKKLVNRCEWNILGRTIRVKTSRISGHGEIVKLKTSGTGGGGKTGHWMKASSFDNLSPEKEDWRNTKEEKYLLRPGGGHNKKGAIIDATRERGRRGRGKSGLKKLNRERRTVLDLADASLTRPQKTKKPTPGGGVGVVPQTHPNPPPKTRGWRTFGHEGGAKCCWGGKKQEADET